MDPLFLEENYVRKAYQDLHCRSLEAEGKIDEADPNCRGQLQRLPCVNNLRKQIPPNSLILDIGCGDNLASWGDCFTIGLDICLPTEAKKFSKNVDIILADLQHMPFRESVFDLVLLVSVLHHIPIEQRRLQCLRQCLSLLSHQPQPSNAHSSPSNLLVVVWAKEQQSAKFPANDVLVPYNLEDLSTQGHIADIPFNKYSTREQRIIMNSIPVSIVSPLLRICCQNYLPKRLQKQLLDVATRLASIYPMLSSIDFYEEHFQNALKFMIDRIDEIKQLHHQPPNDIGDGNANANEPVVIKEDSLRLKEFAMKFGQLIFEEAYSQLRILHREVLKYRYYHLFQGGELERLFRQICAPTTATARQLDFTIIHNDYEHGNWCIQVQRRDTAIKKKPLCGLG